VLGVGFGALGVTAAACSVPTRPGPSPSPGVSRSPGRVPGSASPAPATASPAAVAAAAERERRLEQLTARLLRVDGVGAGSARRRALVQARNGHRAHLALIAAGTPTASSPPLRGGDLADQLARLVRDEKAASAAYLAAAGASSGLDCLLLSSLGCAAAGYADGLRSGRRPEIGPADAARGDVVPPSEVVAMQDLVAQQHAIIYGYQLAIGRLAGSARERALARLRGHRLLQDTLVDQLTTRSADAPAAAPAYVPPVLPTTADRSVQLLRRMEMALQPWVGRWVAAAADPAARARAGRALMATTRSAVGWGSALPAWPGWPA
jgi:hypothetical protein